MSFVKDLFRDEIRDGFLVTANTKKVWNRQLELWAEVERICRKCEKKYWRRFVDLMRTDYGAMFSENFLGKLADI